MLGLVREPGNTPQKGGIKPVNTVIHLTFKRSFWHQCGRQIGEDRSGSERPTGRQLWLSR